MGIFTLLTGIISKKFQHMGNLEIFPEFIERKTKLPGVGDTGESIVKPKLTKV